jgi:hypothetical protein
LYAKRKRVNLAMLSLGQRAWRAITSSEPDNVEALLKTDTSALPFLADSLERFLEELPLTIDGLARSERQLMEGISSAASSFGDVFRYATKREERIYCGDASAALYLDRLARGQSPLVSIQWNGESAAELAVSEPRSFNDAMISLTDAGRSVLRGDEDWIALGGSDRWLGGMHLEGKNARWRWDAANRRTAETR